MAITTILRGGLRLLFRAAAYSAMASFAVLAFFAVDAGLHNVSLTQQEQTQIWPAHAAAPGAIRAAPLPPLPRTPARESTIVQDTSAFDIAALGARVRHMPAREGWLVVNVLSGTGPLRTGDVIVGACDTARPISADLPAGMCVRVIRGQLEVEVKD